MPESKALLTRERVGKKRSMEKLDNVICHQPNCGSGVVGREGGRAHKRVCLEPPEDMTKPVDQKTHGGMESKDFSALQSLLSLRNTKGCGTEERAQWIKFEADTGQPTVAA